jgi:hypothetical protein
MTIEGERSDSRSQQASGAVSVTPAVLARDVLQSFLEQRWDKIETLIHPDADLEAGFAVPGARFDKDRLLRSSWVAFTSGAYKPEYDLIQALDDSTALVAVRLRYEIGKDLFSKREAVYVMSFKDGLLWRNRIFDSMDDALTAHQADVLE